MALFSLFGHYRSSNIIQKKRQLRNDKIESLPKHLRDVETPLPYPSSTVNAILNSTTQELLERLGSGEWNAVTVVSVFIKSAVQANEKTNCITECLFQEALERAKMLDQTREKTGNPVGSLHGLPMSVKDSFHVEGCDATLGFTSYAFKPASKNSLLVDILLRHGAIIICKTNVPQTLMSFECDNPIFGRTLNPYSKNHTCGGSSGGEGALIALKGSVMGLGTDVGGSLRFPAAFCGIYSLKPSVGRLSCLDSASIVPGQEGIIPVAGPMARSVEDLEILTSLFVKEDLWKDDPAVVPISWKNYLPPKKLRFGYYIDDGYLRASPAVQRAVLDTVKALKASGHDVFPFHPPDVPEAISIAYNLFAADNFRSLTAPIKSDPIVSAIKSITYLLQLPSVIPRIAAWILRKLGDWKSSLFLEAVGSKKGVAEIWNWQSRRNDYRVKFLRAWEMMANEHGKSMDALICPVHALPSVKHDTFQWLSACASYSMLYNILDYTTGVLPISNVHPVIDSHSPFSNSASVLETEDTIIHKQAMRHYNVDEMNGLPIGIQVVGKRLEEEKVLKLMKIVEQCVIQYRDLKLPSE